MKNVMKWVKEEMVRMLPVFVFFFVIFSLVDISRILLHSATEAAYSFVVIFMAALVMAKVVLISNILPFIDFFKEKPLIYSTLWKTGIYVVCSIFVRVLERILPLIFEDKGMIVVDEGIVTELERLPFWISQAWIFVLLLVFVAWQELVKAVGSDKVHKLFFGR